MGSRGKHDERGVPGEGLSREGLNATKRTEKSRWEDLPGEGTTDSLRRAREGSTWTATDGEQVGSDRISGGGAECREIESPIRREVGSDTG